MNIYDAIMFETDLQREHYISGLEIVDMLESTQGRLEPNTVIAFLEAIKVFELPMYYIVPDRRNKPEYSTMGINEGMIEDLLNYFECKEAFIADQGWHSYIFEAHDAAQSKISSCYWEKAELLKIEYLVENSSLVTWGNKRVLRHMYADIIENNRPLFLSFAKNAQKSIKEFMSVTETGEDNQFDDVENVPAIKQLNNNSLASYMTEYTLPQVVALILHIDLADITTNSSNSYIHENGRYDESTYSKFNNLVQSYSIAALNNKLDGTDVFTRTTQSFLGSPDTQIDLEKTTISRGKLASYLDSIGYQLDDLIAKQDPVHTQYSQYADYQQDESELILSLQQQVAELQAQLAEKDKALKAETKKLEVAQNKIKELGELSNNDKHLSERSEKSYQTTIGLMLELLTKPRNEGGTAPFDSESLVITRLSEKGIYGQGKTKLGERFKEAKDALADEDKKLSRPRLIS